MKKKRVEWKVWVYRNNYREKQGEYPRVMLRGNMDMDGLAAEVARRAGTYNVETVRAIASLLERTAEELLVEGYSVTGRLGTLTPAVTGMWNPDRTSPSARAQNRAVARYAMGGALKEAFADPLFHEEARAAAVPVIGEARNADAEAEGRTAWRTGDLVEVRGKLLMMNGDDPARGLYFVDEETGGEAVHLPAEELRMVTRSGFTMRVPALPPGRYRLRATTQCTTSPRPLSQPRTGDSDMTFIINNEG